MASQARFHGYPAAGQSQLSAGLGEGASVARPQSLLDFGVFFLEKKKRI